MDNLKIYSAIKHEIECSGLIFDWGSYELLMRIIAKELGI